MEIAEIGMIATPDKWSGQRECDSCQAKIDFSTADLDHFHWFGTHFRHDYAGIKCPACGTILQCSVPKPVREIAMKKQSVFDGTDQSIY